MIKSFLVPPIRNRRSTLPFQICRALAVGLNVLNGIPILFGNGLEKMYGVSEPPISLSHYSFRVHLKTVINPFTIRNQDSGIVSATEYLVSTCLVLSKSALRLNHNANQRQSARARPVCLRPNLETGYLSYAR